MQPDPSRGSESPAVIRERTVALVDYLMAVRAQMEKPARTVPTADAVWQQKLPSHPECEVGPGRDGGSWLRVGHPASLRPVKVPPQLASFVTGGLSYDQEPRLVVKDDEDAEELRWRFERWRDDEWRPWAAAAATVEQVRDLHDRLFDLRHRLDMAAATEELVFGHGIVVMQIGGARVQYPLVVTPVAIEFEADRSQVDVSPQGAARLQTNPLGGLEPRYLSQLLALAGPGGEVDVDLWDDFERREFFERALRRLGRDPVIRDLGADDPGVPHIHDTFVLFSRPRQRMLRRFLEEWRSRLLDGDAESIGALAAVLAEEPSRLRMPYDQSEQWGRTGERLLMPLPTNDAQESIARRLAQHRNVAVQGPPGTGKTHTIRNLISHLMANGKRVLVVAQKEDPLRVLRDGLPEEIRALCLAVLGRSADQLTQLQLSARELSDRAATLNQKAEQARVNRLRTQLEEAERELGRALAGLCTIAENESAHYEIDGVQLSPSEVGSWLRERAEAYGDIPDTIATSEDAPLGADEFTELLDIARRTTGRDRVQALRHLPIVADLPASTTVLRDRTELTQTAEELDRLSAAGVDVDAIRATGEPLLNDLLVGLRDAVAMLAAREGAWFDRLAGLIQSGPTWQELWDDHVANCDQLLRHLVTATRWIGGHDVVVPDSLLAEPRRLVAVLAELRQRFAAGKGVSRLTNGGLAKLASECRVDGEPLRTVQDVDLVRAIVDRSTMRRDLTGRWTAWAKRLDFALPEQTDEPELWAARLQADAQAALNWDRRRWPELHTLLRRLIPRADATVDSARLQDLVDRLARCGSVFRHDSLIAADRVIAARLQEGTRHPEASELWRLLDRIWQDAQLPGWDETLTEVRRLAALRPDAQRFATLAQRLAALTPEWADAIDAGRAPALHGSGADCLHRWQWRQAQTWFASVVGSVDPAVLGRRVEQVRQRIRQLTRELVVASSWLEVSRALDDRRRAALADWSTALRKIGKGTGKSAAHWQAHAQRAMRAAVDAVPVWVMSIDRAIEQFAGGTDFDVVIVDEASQADLFSLPVLSLARRAVVVGDDQQIGPQLRFVGDVNGLINVHLTDVPSAEHFDPESSLYDHAVRRSPERILLTEHFRCVPAIIGFSSKTYYDGAIQPLRTDLPQGIGEPVIAVHVPDGIRQNLTGFGDVNVAEAEALVARVGAIVADPAYQGKTIGVVSLLSSSGQALYLLERIRQTIGTEEMERRRLRVGDSYTFQGDERDIVLLSLVASPHHGPVSAFTGRDHHRRVNVAASRARDQLWVFHSVQPADLRPDDARGLLLTYCQNVTFAEESYDSLEGRCDSDFEREVLRRILLCGYRPLPQFPIGGYRIDFVLPAPGGRRLAIECDGDAYHGPEQWESDMRRQAVLERVGNCVFVRIRGSVFSRDPDAALAPLWQRIEEMGIGTWTPAAEAPVSTQTSAADRPALDVPLVVVANESGPDTPATAEERAAEEGVVSGDEPLIVDEQASAKTPTATEESAAMIADADVTRVESPAAAPRPVPDHQPRMVEETTTVTDTWRRADATEHRKNSPISTAEAVRVPPMRDAPQPSRPVPHATASTARPEAAEPDDGAIPVPVGYRSVAWLRPYEALAALDSYEQCRDVPVRHEGKVLGWARYYDSASPEARLYKANIKVERAFPGGPETACWVRRREAKAVVHAANAKHDVPFEDSHGRHAGIVQFFPATSPAATRFRSVTRLLRASRRSAGGTDVQETEDV